MATSDSKVTNTQLPVAGKAELDQEREQAKRLAARYRCGFIDLMEQRIDPDLFRTIPADLMFRYNFVPLAMHENTLVIAVADPSQVILSDELPLLLGKKLAYKVATPRQIGDLLKRTEQSQRVLEQATEAFTLQVAKDNLNKAFTDYNKYKDGPAQSDLTVALLLPAAIIPVPEMERAGTMKGRFRGDHLFLQPGDGHDDFKYGTGRILPLDGAILQGMNGIVDQASPVFGRNPPRKEVGVKIGLADHGQDVPVPGVQGYDRSLLAGHGLFGGLLEFQVQGQIHVVSRVGLDLSQDPDFLPPGIDLDLAAPVFAHQVALELLFDAVFPH